MLKEFLRGRIARREKFKEMEGDFRAERAIQQKQKNSNERELERFEEEARQVNIKKRLDAFRKVRGRELFKNDLLKSPPLFNAKATVLNNDLNVMRNDGMFLSKGNMLR